MNIVYNEPPATSEPVATEVLPGSPAGPGGAALIRVSWRAIFAGLVLVLAIEILLDLLGIGVGLNFVGPRASGIGFGIGEGIWWMVSTIIALLFGCYAAARLAGVVSRWDGVLHGLVIWGGAVLIAAYLLTSAVGGLIGGAFSVLGGAVSILPQIAQTTGVNPDVLQQQAQNALKAPANVRRQAVGTARQTAATAAATTSELALLAFAAMVISLVAAGIGGALATPRPPFFARWHSRPPAGRV